MKPSLKRLPVRRANFNYQRQKDFQEPYSIESLRFFDLDSLTKFNLKCLKRYFALWKRPSVTQQKQIHQRRRDSKKPIKSSDIVGQNHVR